MSGKLRTYAVAVGLFLSLIGYVHAADRITILKASQAGGGMLFINGSGGYVVDPANDFVKIQMIATDSKTGQELIMTGEQNFDKTGWFATLQSYKGTFHVTAKLYTKDKKTGNANPAVPTPSGIDVTVK